MEWCAAGRHYTVLSAISQAAAEGFEKHAWQLAWAMTDYFHRSGHWQDIVSTPRTSPWPPLANLVIPLPRLMRIAWRGALKHGKGTSTRRCAHQQQALALWEAIGDLTGQAHAHLAFGFVAETRENTSARSRTARGRLRAIRRPGIVPARHDRSAGIAWNYALLGQLDAALKFGEKSLSLHRELGNQHGEADVLLHLAYQTVPARRQG